MKCISGKLGFESREEAEEALVENHIHYKHRSGMGPLNVYPCMDCGQWHFTSKGPMNQQLQDARARIEKMQKHDFWKDKFR